MQEKFVLKAKTAIKRVAAISAGGLMLGATVLGSVAAIDLGDYPAPFVADGQWSGLVVVGSNANAADIVGATDIVGRLHKKLFQQFQEQEQPQLRVESRAPSH